MSIYSFVWSGLLLSFVVMKIKSFSNANLTIAILVLNYKSHGWFSLLLEKEKK